MKTFWAVLFVWLWVMDTFFTLTFIHSHGLQMEANPVVAWLVEHGGESYFVLAKAAAAFPAMLLYEHMSSKLYAFLCAAVTPAVILGGLVVFGAT